MRLPTFVRSPLARLIRSVPARGRWRLAPLLNRLFPAGTVDISLPDLGQVRLDLSDEDQLQIYWTGLHHDDTRILRMIRAALPTDGVFVDVGANIGIHTLAAARHLATNGGTVLSFEPHPRNFQTLTHNLRQNNHRHVTVENVGLAESPDLLTCHGEAHGGNWSLASRGATTFEVQLVRLDDYLDQHPLPQLDVMKIDVEGAEVRVLRGAVRTIERFRPVIVFEVCPAWLGRLQTSTSELLATLEGMDYTIHGLANDNRAWGDRVLATDLVNMGSGDWANLVAVPAEPRRLVPTPVAELARK